MADLTDEYYAALAAKARADGFGDVTTDDVRISYERMIALGILDENGSPLMFAEQGAQKLAVDYVHSRLTGNTQRRLQRR